MQAWTAECEHFILSYYGKESVPWSIFNTFNRRKLDGNYKETFDEQKNIIISALTSCLRITPMNKLKIEESNKTFDKTKVFIVHGQDDEAKTKVARYITKLGLNPIILHEQASSGKTIIEKIEEYSDVGFGIVIYTPCDTGGKQAEIPILKNRARQNVVFEYGYLIGKIGRNNVCALLKNEIEIPNDISGVIYIEMDKTDAWQILIAKELKNSGYKFDLNSIIE
jgi:predicted nucleotide-binding protein